MNRHHGFELALIRGTKENDKGGKKPVSHKIILKVWWKLVPLCPLEMEIIKTEEKAKKCLFTTPRHMCKVIYSLK